MTLATLTSRKRTTTRETRRAHRPHQTRQSPTRGRTRLSDLRGVVDLANHGLHTRTPSFTLMAALMAVLAYRNAHRVAHVRYAAHAI